jgi:hypothetical protein
MTDARFTPTDDGIISTIASVVLAIGLVALVVLAFIPDAPRAEPIYATAQDVAKQQCAKFGHSYPHYRTVAGATTGVVFRSARFRDEFFCMNKDGVSVPVAAPPCREGLCIVGWKKPAPRRNAAHPQIGAPCHDNT